MPSWLHICFIRHLQQLRPQTRRSVRSLHFSSFPSSFLFHTFCERADPIILESWDTGRLSMLLAVASGRLYCGCRKGWSGRLVRFYESLLVLRFASWTSCHCFISTISCKCKSRSRSQSHPYIAAAKSFPSMYCVNVSGKYLQRYRQTKSVVSINGRQLVVIAADSKVDVK